MSCGNNPVWSNKQQQQLALMVFYQFGILELTGCRLNPYGDSDGIMKVILALSGFCMTRPGLFSWREDVLSGNKIKGGFCA